MTTTDQLRGRQAYFDAARRDAAARQAELDRLRQINADLLNALEDLRIRYITLFALYAEPTYEGSRGESDLALALSTANLAIAKARAATPGADKGATS